ncbi:MAG: hypothetical protein KAI79_12100 [Bacteroidales bacterium]|nr:hypothetical protein [Bacteroidales bacterium]
MRDLEIKTDLQYSTDNGFTFGENFKILRYNSIQSCSISLYIDYGNLDDYYDIEQDCIIEDSRENRVKIQRYITQQSYKVVSETFGTVEEIIEVLYNIDYNNIEELYSVLDDLGIDYTSNYLRTSTRGYSQGDYAEILINTVEYEKMVGVPFELDKMQKWFDHYFWDSTIYGTIEVSFVQTKDAVQFPFMEEFKFNEWCNDEYEADSLSVNLMVAHIAQTVKVPLSEDDIAQIKTELHKIDYNAVVYI